MRDMEEFLSFPCVIHPEKQINLCTLLPDLNMAEQFSVALLSEAEAQGWDTASAEAFYRHAVGNAQRQTADIADADHPIAFGRSPPADSDADPVGARSIFAQGSFAA